MKARSLALFLAFAAGCSSPPPSVRRGDSDLIVEPNGDEDMANFVLALPPDYCFGPTGCAHPTTIENGWSLDDQPLKLGQPLRVLPGKHRVNVTLVGETTPPLYKEVVLAAGATSTLQLAVFTLDCQPDGRSVPPTDFGRQAAAWRDACPHVKALDGVLNRRVYAPFESGAARAVLPGNYTFAYDAPVLPAPFRAPSATPDEDHALAAGDVGNLAITLPIRGTVPARFETKLTFVDAPSFRDARPVTISSSCERPYSTPSSPTPLVLEAFQFPECKYNVVAGTTLPLDQTTTNDVHLHRLDVKDVVVTREDGSKYTTSGKYSIRQNGVFVDGPFDTQTGIDLLPGNYELVVSYSTAVGRQTNTYPIAF